MADETPVGVENAATENPTVTAEVLDPAKAEPAGGDNPQAQQTEGETEQEKEHKRKGGWQRKIEKQAQEIEFWREQALRNQPKPAETKPAEPVIADKRPEPKEDESLADYMERLADWKAEQRYQAAERARQESEAKAAREKEQKSAQEQWRSKVDAARSKFDDFDDVALAPDVPYSEAMVQAVASSDLGAEIAYHLGQNKAEAERIAKLNPIAAAREIGRIEARLAHQPAPAAPAEPVAQPVTKAPKPPDLVRKPTGTTTIDLNDPKVPKDVWFREREKQVRAQK